jgi:AhpD family alkylhydroperoxidase
MSHIYKLTLPKRIINDPDASISGMLKGVQEKWGMVPGMYAGMVNYPPLLQTYLDGYDGFRRSSGFTPAEQEIVFLTISRLHECRYCMAAHSLAADGLSKVPPEVTDAIRNDQPIADSKLEALRKFTRIMAESRGTPTPGEGQAFLDAGYTEAHMLAVILAIGVKVISNYSNHLFHTELDPGFSARAWSPPA